MPTLAFRLPGPEWWLQGVWGTHTHPLTHQGTWRGVRGMHVMVGEQIAEGPEPDPIYTHS